VIGFESLTYQFADHGYEFRMRSGCPGPYHVQAQVVAELGRLSIQIKEDLHVVGYEADWGDDDIDTTTLALYFAKTCEDVWLKPWLRGWAASALIDQPPFFASQLLCHQPACFPELHFVVA